MTPGHVTGDSYIVDGELASGREISPFEDWTDGDGSAIITCPSCKVQIAARELIMEGGISCPGCKRNVRLHITAHDQFGEWRNIPESEQEAHR